MSSYLSDYNQPMVEFDNCPSCLERYLEYLQTNLGKRPRTTSETMLILRGFCQYVHYRHITGILPDAIDTCKDQNVCDMEISELAQVGTAVFEEYVYYLDRELHNSASTIRKKISIIRSFYAYLIQLQQELGVAFPYGNPTSGRISQMSGEDISEPVTLTVPQLGRLLSAVPGSNVLRDTAILLTLIVSGITVSELTALNRSDYDSCSGWLRISGANAVRYVYLTSDCRNKIDDYLTTFRTGKCDSDGQEPLFCSSRVDRKRLTTRHLRNLIVSIGVNAGLGEDVTPKVLRDTTTSILLNCAGDEGHLQVLAYLGYNGNTRLRNRLAPSTFKKFRGNPFMKSLVLSSPLAELGNKRTKEARI